MTEAWDEAAEATRRAATLPPLTPELEEALLGFLTRDDALYEGDRLRVGADLKPDGEGCDRQTWYRLRGVAKDAPRLGDELRFHGGRVFERTFVESLAHAGIKVETQVVCWPLRPSFWAWAPGHADALLVERKHLVEVKAPRAALFDRAKNDPKRLVKPAYRFQLSFYFHELKRRGRAETASWLFLDREGSHAPVEVPLTPDLLVPLEEIVALEGRKAALLAAAEAPPRLAPAVVVSVWKGGRKSKANPNPERRVEAAERRPWNCSYCPWIETCQPGPEERVVTLEPGSVWRRAAIERAEAAWGSGDKVTPQVTRFGAEDDGEQEVSAAPQVGETGPALGQVPAVRDAGDDAALHVPDARPVPGVDSVSQNNGAGASPTPAADAIPPTPVGEVLSTPAANPPYEAAPPAVSEAPPLHVIPPDRSSTREAAGSSLSQRETTDARPEWMRVYARSLATADDVQLTEASEASGHAVKHEGPEW